MLAHELGHAVAGHRLRIPRHRHPLDKDDLRLQKEADRLAAQSGIC